MSTEEHPPLPAEEESGHPVEPTSDSVVISTDETRPDEEEAKVVADAEQGRPLEDAHTVDDAPPRQSLDLEGSDLEEEMNQMSTHHAALMPPAHELSPALDGQSTPTGAGPSSPFSRKAVPPEILTTSPSNPALAGAAGLHPPDSPTAEIIETLRAQLEAVTDQRDMLNTKLVTSFSRVADLEDDLDHLKQTQTEQKSKIDILEYERKEHLHALDTGLLVERSNVRSEMQKLAATLVEEQGKRGVAEEGRRTVENEVDDLAATLFQQANSMVATERLARSRAETRLASTEENLQVAEGVVRELQVAMQALSHGAGSASFQTPQVAQAGSSKPRPLLTDHVPYREFVLFVQHLRSLRPLSHSATQIPPPTLVSLIAHPFIARLVAEDHEPALRLDFAPGVTYFSKKTISQAIIDGMLVVEPVQAHKVFLQKPQEDVACTLSGRTIVPMSANKVIISPSAHAQAQASSSDLAQSASTSSLPPPPTHPLARASLSSGASRFFSRNSRPASPTSSQASLPAVPSPPMLNITSSHPPIYIFRVAPPPTSQPSSNPPHLYPIESGWTLERLRATCELWRFLKTGIVAPIWSYEDGTTAPAPAITEEPSSLGLTVGGVDGTGARPALPPRKSSKGWGLFGKSGSGTGSGSGWNLGLGSNSGSTSPSAEKSQEKEIPKLPPRRVVAPPPMPPRAEDKVPPVTPSAQETDAPAVVVSAPAPADESTSVPEPSAAINVSTPQEDVSTSPAVESDAPPPATEPVPAESPASSAEESTSVPAPGSATSSEGFRTPKEEDTPLPTPAAPSTEGDAEVEPTLLAAEPPTTAEASATPSEDTATAPATEEDSQDAEKEKDAAPPAVTDEPVPSADAPAPVSAVLADDSTSNTPIRTSLDGARPSTPSTPGGSAPPPLPRRAAARRPVPAPPGGASISSISDVLPATTPTTPVVVAAPIPEVEEKAVATEVIKSAEDESAREADPVEKVDDEPKEGGEAVVAAAPALPPRKEAEAAVEVQEGWEEKTWRELVKVREDLFWKRIGVKADE